MSQVSDMDLQDMLDRWNRVARRKGLLNAKPIDDDAETRTP